MTRSPGYSLAAVLVVLLLPGMGSAAAAQRAAEPPLTAIVATGATGTAAVLADGTWQVELAALQPGDTDPAVSPDGQRVAFVSERDGNPEIYVADSRTGEVRRLTRNRRAADLRPAWSPGGRSVVWQSGRPGAADLYVMRANGSRKRRLVGGAGDDGDPVWSPDGARIAFSTNRSGRRQLWTVAAAGGTPEPLTQSPGRIWAPAWSPDGTRLVFSRELAGGSDLWMLNPSVGVMERLTRGGAWDSRPNWSPSGRHIAFARAAAGRSSIWVVTADGTNAREVESTDDLTDPDWAESDRSLVPRPDEQLPDLDQRAPAGLAIFKQGRRFGLGFASSTENHGIGPLAIRGVRDGRSMRADQIVEHLDGTSRVVRDVGRLHYELHNPHHHWHLQSFVGYELRRASDFAVLVRDRKTGFCLMDRWGRVSPKVPGSGPPRFVDDCGAEEPRAHRVTQGTSVGYIDRYPAFFHGQQLDVSGLPAGRYVLVHRANPQRAMRELRYSNDVASVLLQLTWPNGATKAPRFKILRRCEGSERCPPRSVPDVR